MVSNCFWISRTERLRGRDGRTARSPRGLRSTRPSQSGAFFVLVHGVSLLIGDKVRQGHIHVRGTCSPGRRDRRHIVRYVLPAVLVILSASFQQRCTAPERDEVDIELLGGDPSHWQTNVFAPAPSEDQPLYSAFSSVQDYPHSPKNVDSTHAYTIDWSPDRIVWSVDGSQVRTLQQGASSSLHGPQALCHDTCIV